MMGQLVASSATESPCLGDMIPEDFVQALAANPTARQNFEVFSDSSKKHLLWHIESAKRPETRTKRIGQIVEAAEQNIKPLQYNARKKS